MARTAGKPEQARVAFPTGKGQPPQARTPLFGLSLETETDIAGLRDKLDWLENNQPSARMPSGGRWDDEPDVEFW